MKVIMFPRENAEMDLKLTQGEEGEDVDVVRVEVPLVADEQYNLKVILLDADDTFDIIVEYPDETREAVWSIVKDSEGRIILKSPEEDDE